MQNSEHDEHGLYWAQTAVAQGISARFYRKVLAQGISAQYWAQTALAQGISLQQTE